MYRPVDVFDLFDLYRSLEVQLIMRLIKKEEEKERIENLDICYKYCVSFLPQLQIFISIWQ